MVTAATMAVAAAAAAAENDEQHDVKIQPQGDVVAAQPFAI